MCTWVHCWELPAALDKAGQVWGWQPAKHAAPALLRAAALRYSMHGTNARTQALVSLPPSSPALQLDTNEWVLFVHKRLPAIKTRPEGEPVMMLQAPSLHAVVHHTQR